MAMNEKKVRLDRGQIEVVDDAMADLLRRKTPAERIKIGFSIWTSAHKMLTVHIKKTHPDWDQEKVERVVAERFQHGSL